jgi:deoxyhypusine synthase
LDWSKLRFKSRQERAHKVAVNDLGHVTTPGCSFGQWLDALPAFLGANELRQTVAAVVAARRAGRPVVFAFGGHVIKTGCSPLVIDLIERGIITALATNGSGAIHDLELAETGATSEEVGDTIRDGSFGMVRETCVRMNEAAARGAHGAGLGRALGELLNAGDAPYKHLSILAAAARTGIPATVHVAIGTDTVHMHPEADGAAIGAATLADFRIICAVVAELGAAAAEQTGGVWLNVGSAVILPEVFLKAVSVARNLGRSLDGLHTVNLDMLPHYRPTQNVVTRPVAPGHGHTLLGQHEILLPLLRQALVEELGQLTVGKTRENTP